MRGEGDDKLRLFITIAQRNSLITQRSAHFMPVYSWLLLTAWLDDSGKLTHVKIGQLEVKMLYLLKSAVDWLMLKTP